MNFAFRYIFSSAKKEPGRILLVVLGLSLAIATFCAIRLANDVSLRSFESTARFLRGNSDLVLSSLSGRIDFELVSFVTNFPGIRSASGRLERAGLLSGDSGHEHVRVLALDLLKNSEFDYYNPEALSDREQFFSVLSGETILVSPALLSLIDSKLGYSVLQVEGHSIDLTRFTLLPLSLLGDDFSLVLDLEVYLDRFGKDREIDAIDLIFDQRQSLEQSKSELFEILGPYFTLSSEEESKERLATLTEALRVNLHYMAAIALFVAMLVVYHVMSFLGVRRRADFSLLKSIGAAPGTLWRLLFFEAVLLGLIGAVLGYGLGYTLAVFVSADLSSTIKALYAQVVVQEVSFTLKSFIEAILLGVAFSVVSVVPIAYEASRVTHIGRGSGHDEMRVDSPANLGWALAGFGILMASLALSDLTLVRNYPGLGLLLALLLSVGVLCLLPLCFWWFLKAVRPFCQHPGRVALLLAIDHMTSSFRRGSVTIASVALALGMFIGITTMISSFRGSVSNWMQETSDGDVYISLPGPYQNRSTERLPVNLIEFLRASPVVSEGTQSVVVPYRFSGNDIFVRSYQPLLDSKAQNMDNSQQCSLAVSESFARRYQVDSGQELALTSSKGAIRYEIKEVVADYSSERGTVYLSPQCFEQLLGSFETQAISLKLDSQTDSEEFITEIRDLFPDLPLQIRDGQGLRDEVIETFDATFKITYALQTISLILVSFIILNTILILFFERKHEFATLRAIGASLNSLRALAVIEALIISVLACIFAFILGIVLSLFLIYVINLAYFGWSVVFSISWQIIGVTFVVTLILVAALTFILSKGALQKNMQEALRYE